VVSAPDLAAGLGNGATVIAGRFGWQVAIEHN
jgi:hypothetical protein